MLLTGRGGRIGRAWASCTEDRQFWFMFISSVIRRQTYGHCDIFL